MLNASLRGIKFLLLNGLLLFVLMRDEDCGEWYEWKFQRLIVQFEG